MTAMVLVSVVMPVFNARGFLSESIASVLNQTYNQLELIIVDDGSTDGGYDICEQWALEDSRITLLSQLRKGEAGARNSGIAASKGDLIAVQDADDISEPHRIRRQVDYMVSHPTIAALGSYMVTFGLAQQGRLVMKPTHHASLALQIPWQNPILHPTAMIQRSVLDEVGHYRPLQSPDLELWTRIMVNHRVANIPEMLVRYRRHEQQTSLDNYHSANNERVYQARRSFLANHYSVSTAQRFTKDVHEVLTGRTSRSLPTKTPARSRIRAIKFVLRHALLTRRAIRSGRELAEALRFLARKLIQVAFGR